MCAGAHAREIDPGYAPIFPRDMDVIEMTKYDPPSNAPTDLENGRISSQTDTDPRIDAICGGFLTFDDVEARLVEAITLWWRMPGGGKSPYATDGPWELIRAEWGDYYDPDARPRLPPLSRAQIARMQEATEWMRYVPERDRRLVALALNTLAKGAAKVPWMALRKPLGVKLGADGLRMRYARALSLVAQRVNGRTC